MIQGGNNRKLIFGIDEVYSQSKKTKHLSLMSRLAGTMLANKQRLHQL